MPKFRTMRENTPELATDKLKNPNKYITKFGKFLRKTSNWYAKGVRKAHKIHHFLMDDHHQIMSIYLSHHQILEK